MIKQILFFFFSFDFIISILKWSLSRTFGTHLVSCVRRVKMVCFFFSHSLELILVVGSSVIHLSLIKCDKLRYMCMCLNIRQYFVILSMINMINTSARKKKMSRTLEFYKKQTKRPTTTKKENEIIFFYSRLIISANGLVTNIGTFLFIFSVTFSIIEWYENVENEMLP